MIARLTEAGAAVIAFDIVFAEPDRLSPSRAVDSFRGLDEAIRTQLKSLPDNDQIFAEALRRSPVVLGESGLPYLTPVPAADPPPLAAALAPPGGSAEPVELAPTPQAGWIDRVPIALRRRVPAPLLRTASAARRG